MVTIREVFYSEAKGNIIDVVVPGTGLGCYSSKTLAQYVQDDPTMVQISEREASNRIDARNITEPTRIEADEFDYLLNVLPPVNWRSAGNGESFQLSELYVGRITTTVAKIDGHCFKWHDRIGSSYLELIDKARKALAASQVTP